jgi:hypothetical protein
MSAALGVREMTHVEVKMEEREDDGGRRTMYWPKRRS